MICSQTRLCFGYVGQETVNVYIIPIIIIAHTYNTTNAVSNG